MKRDARAAQLRPRVVMSSDERKRLGKEYEKVVEVTQECFRLLDNAKRPRKRGEYGSSTRQFETTPDWLRPLACISLKHNKLIDEEIIPIIWAGLQGDWVQVEYFVMAHEYD